MTLWAMARSPLMFGGDVRKLDDTTYALITNPTALEINSFSSNNKEACQTTKWCLKKRERKEREKNADSNNIVHSFCCFYSFLTSPEQRNSPRRIKSSLHTYQIGTNQLNMLWALPAVRIQKQRVGQIKQLTKILNKSAGKRSLETKLKNLYAYTRGNLFWPRNFYTPCYYCSYS